MPMLYESLRGSIFTPHSHVSSMASEDDYQLCPNATQVITDNSSGIVDVECMYPTGLDSNASVWRNSTRTRKGDTSEIEKKAGRHLRTPPK